LNTHPVNNPSEIPNNPQNRRGVTRPNNEESGLYGQSKYFNGKWHPKFQIELTLDIWYQDTDDGLIKDHEWRHAFDMIKAFDLVANTLFDIETSYDKYSFDDKDSCDRFVKNVIVIESDLMRIANIQSIWTRDTVHIAEIPYGYLWKYGL
jgi:hypothetical protein